MAIDPSIYAQLGKGVVQPINQLTSLGQVIQTGNALIQGKQAMLAMRARTAMGQAYQNTPLDPTTGLPDNRQFVANLQNTPGGGYAMAEAIPALQKQQLTQFELNKAQQEQSVGRMNTVNGALSSLLAKGSNVTRADVFGVVGGLQAAGLPVDQFISNAAMTMPGQDGAPLHDWVLNQASRAWPAATQAEQFTPRVQYQNVGGQMVPVDMNPQTNPGLAGSRPLTMGLTPSEQASQVKGPIGPNGQPTVISQAAYAQQNGLGGLVQSNGSSGTQSPFGNGGRFPSSLLNPNRQDGAPQPGGAVPPNAAAPGSIGAGSPGYAPASPVMPVAATGPASGTPQYLTHADERFPSPGAVAATSATQPVSVQHGTPSATPAAVNMPALPNAAPAQYGAPMATGLGPGQQAGITAAGDASAKQWAQLQSSVGGSAGRIYQLQSALGDLQGAGPTGPSSGTINNMKSYLLSLPVVGQSLGIDPNKVASYDEANKYLTAYAAARAGRFGGTTDSQLATTLSSNASTHISGLAAQDVVKANIGLERMDQAQLTGFQNGLDPVTGQPTGQQFTPDQFADYSSRWNTAHDARAFVADKLTPQQFSATLSGMSPADQARFQQSFNGGIAQGFIDPPAWMQQPQQGGGATAPSAIAPASAAPAGPSPAATPQAAPSPMQSAAAAPYSVAGMGLPAIAAVP